MSQKLDQGAHSWHKASASAEETECVEVGLFPPGSTADVAVRDTKAKGAGPVLGFTAESWTAFIGSLEHDGRLTGGAL